MEQNNQIEETEQTTDVALSVQDESTVKILQKDDLENLKTAVEKVKTFKRKYGLKKIAVTDIDNKEQQEKLRLALQDMRTTRTALTKDKKDKTAAYRSTVAYINDNYDKVISEIEKLEDPAKAHKKEIDDKIEEKKQEEENKRKQRVNERVEALLNAGIFFDGEHYTIGSDEFEVPAISLGIVDLESLTDPIFENVLAQVKEKAEMIATATKEKEERLQKEKEEREAAEAEEKRILAEQQAKLLEEQEAMRKEREEMETMRKELEAEKERIAAEKIKEEVRLQAEEKNRIEKLWRDRLDVLNEKGWNGQEAFDRSNNDAVIFTYEEMISLSDDDFNVRAEAYNKVVEDRNEAARLKKEADDKAKAEAEEIERKKNEAIIAVKAIEAKRLKDEADEAARKEELVKQGDQAVWTDYVKKLQAVEVPTFQSEAFNQKLRLLLNVLNNQS